jgi:hypothetical protein
MADHSLVREVLRYVTTDIKVLMAGAIATGTELLHGLDAALIEPYFAGLAVMMGVGGAKALAARYESRRALSSSDFFYLHRVDDRLTRA